MKRPGIIRERPNRGGLRVCRARMYVTQLTKKGNGFERDALHMAVSRSGLNLEVAENELYACIHAHDERGYGMALKEPPDYRRNGVVAPFSRLLEKQWSSPRNYGLMLRWDHPPTRKLAVLRRMPKTIKGYQLWGWGLGAGVETSVGYGKVLHQNNAAEEIRTKSPARLPRTRPYRLPLSVRFCLFSSSLSARRGRLFRPYHPNYILPGRVVQCCFELNRESMSTVCTFQRRVKKERS